jgi:arsenate reductase
MVVFFIFVTLTSPSMIKIYFKPNCSTCRTALQLAKESTKAAFVTIEYLVNTPTEKEIKEILTMLGIKAEQLVRKKESLYKEKFEGKKITNAQWIKILHKNPILIERPIFVDGRRAVIGRPPEVIVEFLKQTKNK